METTFERALRFTLAHEGGYSNHLADKGGSTYLGITQLTYNEYRRRHKLAVADIKEISQQEVKEIYRAYWDGVRGDELPPALAICMFDWAVNSGIGSAVKTLQLILGLTVDGQFGNITKKHLVDKLTSYGLNDLVWQYNQARETKYLQWGTGSQKVFLAGWMNRLNNLKRFVGVM